MSQKFIYLVSFVLVVSQACNAVEVARWDFEETSGTTATDQSGLYVATLGGSDTLDVEGRFGSGIDFAGDGGAVIDLASSEDFRFTGDFSIALWVNSDVEWGAHTRFVDISAADGGLTDSYRLFTHSGDNTDNFKFMSRQDGSNTQNIHTRDMAVGTWILLVLRHDLDGNVTMNVLQDGDSVDEVFVAANSESWPTTGSIVYGEGELKLGRMNGTGRKFDGKMDALAFYDEVLTDAQVATMFYTAGSSEYPLASSPKPADGAMLSDTWVNLSWRPGDLAISHDVYLGDNFDDMDAGAEGTFLGNQATTTLIIGFPGMPFPEGLVPGTTYYWRIDEVNDAEPNSPWKGDVWSFSIPPKNAYYPDPADGAKFIDPNVELSWNPGFGAMLHTVYFGDNFADVNSAAEGLAQADATYTPGPLELEKTYYWRVDEFDGAATNKGDVLSFRTMPEIPITDPNLICWWTLEEGSGTTAVDWSGHGNHGELQGNPQWAAGYDGYALHFVSESDRVVRSLGAAADWPACTVAFWVKPDTVGQNNFSGMFSSHVPNSAGFQIDVDGGNPGYYRINPSDLLFGTVTTSWVHLAVACDGTFAKLYNNGYWVTSGTLTDTTFNQFAIGTNRNATNSLFGIIDDFRIYDKVLTDEEIQLAMRGDPLLAWSPKPTPGSTVYIRDAMSLSWSPGDNASGHDVYFGTDRDAVADANASDTTGIYRGRQGVTIYTPAEGVEWGGGPYYWRVDEYNTDATISKGRIWSFTVTDFILVEDFEDYNDWEPDRIFETWIDGWEVPTNGSTVGYPDPNFDQGEHFVETTIVHGGRQSMPYFYDNNFKYSEATMTPTQRDWTEEGVGVLSLWFYGDASNAAERMYVALNGSAVVYHDNPDAALIEEWTEWTIDLQEFAAQDVNLANVNTISIGFGDKNNLQPGGLGTVYFDDIRLYRPAPPEPEPAP